MKIKLILFSVALGACTSSSASVSPTPTSKMSFEAQAAAGQQLYGEHCAHCHGDAGEGTDRGPAVVGKGALPLEAKPGAKRDVRFVTASDIFGWVKKTMPGDEPGSLKDSEYVAILAFDLQANGVTLKEALSLKNAASIAINKGSP